MGCASSKQKRCCHCNAPYSPVPRSYSMHAHHPPQTEDDTYHVVALTSTTLGTLKLNSPVSNFHNLPSSKGKVRDSGSFRFSNENLIKEEEEEKKKKKKIEKKEEFSIGLIEAKTWSNMIEQKLPKVAPMTPIRTPPGEPETINTWELMEGLEDTSPFRSPNHFKSFSFDVRGGDGGDVDGDGGDVDGDAAAVDPPKLNYNNSPRPLWFHITEEEAKLKPAISDFDPEVIASFKKSLQQLSPESPFYLRPAPCDEEKQGTQKGLLPSSCEEKNTKSGGGDDGVIVDDVKVAPPLCGKDKVVLYFTSLRGVRKTYEDCCQVRMILKGLGVRVDERDVSMHSGFKEELREFLGDEYGVVGGGLLPKVFVGRNCIGGAEEIQRLLEDGKLEKVLDCCERIEESVCETCGDVRFVPCETCSGSCKIYYEGDEDKGDEKEEGETDYDDEMGEYGFQRCPDCNENGLIRCPNCCY